MTTDDRIQAYLDNEMSRDEMNSFEKELSENAALKERYEHYLLARDLSKGLVEIDMRKTLESAKHSSKPKLNRVWLGLLLGLSIILGIYFFRKNRLSESDQYAESYVEPIWPTVRSSSDSLSLIIGEWKKTGNIQKAKKELIQINSLSKEMKNYWIAEMYLNEQEFDSVRVYLPKLDTQHLKSNRVKKIEKWLEEF